MIARLLAVLFAFATAHSPATAQSPAKPSEGVLSALFTYQLALGELRQFMQDCRPDLLGGEADADWERAVAVFAATVYASGLPEELAEEAAATMSMRLGGFDCDDADLAADAEWMAEQGWAASVAEALGYLDLAVVASPPGPEAIIAVEVLFDEETAISARMIECVSVAVPLGIAEAYGNWRRSLAESGRKLIEAGYPRSALLARIEAAEAATVPNPVGGELRAAMRQSCEEEAEWLERYDYGDFEGLTTGVDAIIAGH